MPALSPNAATDVSDDPAGYPIELEREVAGAEGLRYHVRPIRPDDAERLVAFHRQLSPHSVYMRFFTFHPDADATPRWRASRPWTTSIAWRSWRRSVTASSQSVASTAHPAGPRRRSRSSWPTSTSTTGSVSLLLDELARAGWQRGVEVFKAETLAENSAMLDVFRHAGFPVTSGIEYGTVTLRFPIAPTDDYRAALAAREATRQVPPEAPAVTTLVVAGPTGIAEHDGGTYHPEQPSRLFAAMDGVRALGLEDEVVYPPIAEASVAELSRVHAPAYLAELEAFCARGGGDIDPDTYARPDSWTAARRAARRRPGGTGRARTPGGGRGLRAGPPARAPRHRRSGHGVLSGQQRRRGSGVAHRAG